jgi:FkbM family methyltransferase
MSDHDPNYWPVLTRLIPADAGCLIVDAGANRGDMTAQFAAEYPQARIVAVEPHPEVFARLRQRFADHARITCLNAALSDANQPTEFHVNQLDVTSSIFPRFTTGRRYYSSEDGLFHKIQVDTLTLDRLAAQENIPHIDLLKLDTQGAELLIFKGAASLLASQAIDVIYTEFFMIPHYQGAPVLHDLWGFLAQFGYSLYDLFKGPYGRNGQLRFGDAIFVSPRFRAAVLDRYPEEP